VIESEESVKSTEKSHPFSIESPHSLTLSSPSTEAQSVTEGSKSSHKKNQPKRKRKEQLKMDIQNDDKFGDFQSECSSPKPSTFEKFLVINPSELFYKKMGNERHYYIC